MTGTVMKNKFIKCLLLGGLFVLFVSTAFAQVDGQTRSITSDDFASQRPKGAESRAKKSRPSAKTTYKYLRQDKNISRRKSAQPPKSKTAAANKMASKPEKISEIGVTVWKMRPPRKSDTGFKLPVLDDNKIRAMWTAERVSLDAIFQAGDRVRLAVESPQSGYLYVFDREMYSDGSVGEPYLIFPASLSEDNSVKPGMLVDIPDQIEYLPYFVMDPKKENYRGELLTVIITPNPLTNLRVDKDRKLKNEDELDDLETNTEAEIYSRVDTGDKVFTEAESKSACGSKSRQLERPCETNTRQLTREEPLPQTIYRVKTAVGQPAVVFIRLNTQ